MPAINRPAERLVGAQIMHTRRCFLGASLGLPLAMQGTMTSLERTLNPSMDIVGSQQQAAYESIIARMRHMEYLGRPTSWNVVQNGFLPISPERVLILEPKDSPRHEMAGDRWLWAPAKRDRLMKRIADHGETNCRDEQLGLILRITQELASYYSAMEHWEEWAYRLALQESFYPSGIGSHLAVPCQFHVVGNIRTVNRPLDWWMILFPHGIDCWETRWAAPQRIHAIFTLMQSRPWSEDPGVTIGMMSVLSCGLSSLPDTPPTPNFVEISQLDRVSAARLVNYHLVSAIPRFESWLEEPHGR
jgi:hypothetical protein